MPAARQPLLGHALCSCSGQYAAAHDDTQCTHYNQFELGDQKSRDWGQMYILQCVHWDLYRSRQCQLRLMWCDRAALVEAFDWPWHDTTH
jgi:hypothetical protein